VNELARPKTRSSPWDLTKIVAVALRLMTAVAYLLNWFFDFEQQVVAKIQGELGNLDRVGPRTRRLQPLARDGLNSSSMPTRHPGR